MFTKATNFQALKIYTLCLDYTGSSDFTNDFYVHIGNEIAFTYSNYVWYIENEKTEDTLTL